MFILGRGMELSRTCSYSQRKTGKKKAQVDSLAASSGVSNLKVSENNLHLTCYSEATGRECMHKQRVGCSQKENQTAIKMDETTESSAKS